MTNEDFNAIAQQAADMVIGRLIKKGKEYAIGTDRLANFKVQARMYNTTPIKALIGNMGKHQAWLENPLDDPNIIISDDVIWEHVGDIICYYVLLIGLLKERNNELLDYGDTNEKCE